MSTTIVWPSGVWTFTRLIVVSTALTVGTHDTLGIPALDVC
jgi:hypothetical protein